VSFTAAWYGAAAIAVLGACLLVLGVRLVARSNPILIVPPIDAVGPTLTEATEHPGPDPDPR
jgi:hypothetical protein